MQTPIEKLTPYDEFNFEVPEHEFPKNGMSARAAAAVVISDEWTDTNPMLNMSSFVTTYAEPEAAETARRNIFKNYIDHDMYPQLFAMETRMVRWLHQLWTDRQASTSTAPRRWVHRKRACSPALRTNGTGGKNASAKARMRPGRIW
jgi:glutamate/tyrosine decarboxylase-like PLP-dependent enzyme